MRPHATLLLFCALFAVANAVNPCGRSLIRDVTAEEVNYDNSTQTLTCKDGADSLMAIEINSKLYRSLTCDEVNGWKDGFPYENRTRNELKTTIASASEPISVKCVEYCIVESRTGVVSRLLLNTNYSRKVRKLNCDDGQKLFIDGVRSYALCDFNGWIIPSGKSIDTPLQVECRRGCTQGDRTDVIMSLSSKNESKTVFKSSKPEEVGDQHGVSLNGQVYSYLECDSNNGFTDKDGNTIAKDPFESVDLNHDIVPKTTTTTTTTTAKTTTPTGGQTPTPAPPGPSAPSKDESSTEDPEPETSGMVIGISVVALILIVVVIVMISMVVKKKLPENNESNSDSSNSEGKKSKKKRMSSGKDDLPTEVKLEKPCKF